MGTGGGTGVRVRSGEQAPDHGRLGAFVEVRAAAFSLTWSKVACPSPGNANDKPQQCQSGCVCYQWKSQMSQDVTRSQNLQLPFTPL